MNDTNRIVSAVLRNGITWAAAWGLAGGAVVAAIALVAPGPEALSIVERVGIAIVSGGMWGVRFAMAGAVIGTLFAIAIRVGYRSRRLTDINPLQFAALGAVVGGVGVPLFYQTMNVIFEGGPIAWGLVLDDAPWAAVFGAAVAGGSILMARRAAELPEEDRPGRLEQGSELGSLSAGAPAQASLLQRLRSALS